MGAYRLAGKKVLIKNLQSVETLGRTEVVIIDKTGTLTRNELLVSRLAVDDKEYTITGEGFFKEGQVLENGNQVSIQPGSSLEKLAIGTSLLNNQF
jgi:magnesium-transporting ATPase (P-type)